MCNVKPVMQSAFHLCAVVSHQWLVSLVIACCSLLDQVVWQGQSQWNRRLGAITRPDGRKPRRTGVLPNVHWGRDHWHHDPSHQHRGDFPYVSWERIQNVCVQLNKHTKHSQDSKRLVNLHYPSILSTMYTCIFSTTHKLVLLSQLNNDFLFYQHAAFLKKNPPRLL